MASIFFGSQVGRSLEILPLHPSFPLAQAMTIFPLPFWQAVGHGDSTLTNECHLGVQHPDADHTLVEQFSPGVMGTLCLSVFSQGELQISSIVQKDNYITLNNPASL